MRTIPRELFVETVKEMFLSSAYTIGSEVVDRIRKGKKNETDILSKNILSSILDNIEIAQNEGIPLCQDTGVAIVFLEVGNQVCLDFNIQEAVDEAVRISYQEGYLRKSIVAHPLNRVNTMDNTPAIVHTKLVMGNQLDIYVAPKGAGSENMSRLAMLSPSEGVEGVKRFVLETVKMAGGKPCPPIILGIGIGGNFEKSALLAKEALFRPLEDHAINPIDSKLEEELLDLVNGLNVGPMGLGGKTTCLAVKINSYPCHIASLPVAVNIQCHSARKSHQVL